MLYHNWHVCKEQCKFDVCSSVVYENMLFSHVCFHSFVYETILFSHRRKDCLIAVVCNATCSLNKIPTQSHLERTKQQLFSLLNYKGSFLSTTHMKKFDVVVIGDGPAGLTVSLMLAKSGISVWVIGLSLPLSNKILFGETLSPNIKFLLSYLGLWKDFLKNEHLPSAGNRSAWGEESIKENNFIFHPATHGWHLDRLKFNLMLLNAAKRAGAHHFTSKIESVEKRSDNRFDIILENRSMIPDIVRADFVVDATGRKSWFSSKIGILKKTFDNLCGYVCFFSPRIDGDLDSTTLTESVYDGWWYSALLPKKIRVVSFFTDTNLPIVRLMKTFSEWEKMMESTYHVRVSIDEFDYSHISGPHIMMSNSSRLETVVGEDWLAVGDAAVTYDPLSSRGIETAINDAINASDIIMQYLNGNRECLRSYNKGIFAKFDNYLNERSRYYRLEKRWANRAFWKQNQNYLGGYSKTS
jgi:flavin-dependent dehydrogenase